MAGVLGFSRSRVESERWVAFRSWAGIDAFYCRPGLIGAHEKDGVEGQIGARGIGLIDQHRERVAWHQRSAAQDRRTASQDRPH
ncbi:hypothetical protein ACIBHX_01255 [Nonomuraea sp. NPDC050536]|uniref:hypothetical protein n=1 Tax=Nonomuraea sp. NPDC050536 TaxID=3364366 RepID=UPI0037C66FB5